MDIRQFVINLHLTDMTGIIQRYINSTHMLVFRIAREDKQLVPLQLPVGNVRVIIHILSLLMKLFRYELTIDMN